MEASAQTDAVAASGEVRHQPAVDLRSLVEFVGTPRGEGAGRDLSWGLSNPPDLETLVSKEIGSRVFLREWLWHLLVAVAHQFAPSGLDQRADGGRPFWPYVVVVDDRPPRGEVGDGEPGGEPDVGCATSASYCLRRSSNHTLSWSPNSSRKSSPPRGNPSKLITACWSCFAFCRPQNWRRRYLRPVRRPTGQRLGRAPAPTL